MTDHRAADTLSQLVPPPWQLHASGFALLVREPAGLGAVLFVDYARSPVGPYRELLYMPAVQRALWGKGVTIARIYVSTQISVDNGRAHWAIPKQLARFDVHSGREGVRVHVQDEHGEVLDMLLRSSAPTLPFSTHVVPARLRTLVQPRGSASLVTRPSAHGLLQPARVLALRSTPTRFPDLSPAAVVGAAALRRVRLTFPAASRVGGHETA